MKMKSLLVILFAILLIVPVVGAKPVSLVFEWLPNTEGDMYRYALFARQEGQPFDYTKPLDPYCTIVDGKCYVDAAEKTCTYKWDGIAPDGAITTFHFVARAGDSEGYWSADSEQVSYTFDLAPIIAPVIVAAVHNPITKSIDLAFTQEDVDRVVRWELYMSTTSGVGYQKVDELLKPNMVEPYTTSWVIPGDGDYYFTLVSFTGEDVYSINSNEMFVNVKVHPGPMKDFKIKIRIK